VAEGVTAMWLCRLNSRSHDENPRFAGLQLR
jgi:hypothetical protein